jgi:hypothetical protein
MDWLNLVFGITTLASFAFGLWQYAQSSKVQQITDNTLHVIRVARLSVVRSRGW